MKSAPVRRINPIIAARKADVRRSAGFDLPCDHDERSGRQLNWAAIIPVVLLVLYGIWATAGMVDAKIEQARAEGKSEAQAAHIEDLQGERERTAKRQSSFALPPVAVHFLILAVISAAVAMMAPPVGGIFFIIGAVILANGHGLISLAV